MKETMNGKGFASFAMCFFLLVVSVFFCCCQPLVLYPKHDLQAADERVLTLDYVYLFRGQGWHAVDVVQKGEAGERDVDEHE